MNITRPLLLIPFFIMLFTSNAFSEKLDENLTINRLKPDIFIITHNYPWPSNSLLAVLENGDILLVDTPYTPDAMELVLKWIDKKYGKRTIKAINTHFHIDRLGGNEALIKLNIPLYSSELTVNAIKTRGPNSLQSLIQGIKDDSIKRYYLSFKYASPADIFDSKKGLTLEFGTEKIYIRYPGEGHTVDNLVVYLPAKKTIFGGCMIRPIDAKKAGNVEDGNLNEWKKSLLQIDVKNYDLVVPGHGREGGVELIKHTIEILEKETTA